MPKFSFPMPGRRSNKNKNKNTDAEKQLDFSKPAPSPSTVSNSGSSLSKAQRFFGDNDLNIDSPTRDDDSWMVPSSSRSSVMSISISESTHSTRMTEDNGSIHGSQADNWELEGGVFPKPPRLNGKASSTILGLRHGDEGDSRSNMSARLRNEDSSSTLKSYYDRHTSPLAISQQTSASSARDLALRKGLPLVVPKSPLLQVESVDIIESLIPGRKASVDFRSKETDAKKKPTKLDFSLLFPKPRSHGKTGPPPFLSPSPMLQTDGPTTPSSGRRRVMKALSKESLRSQHSTRSNQTQDVGKSQSINPQYQVYDHYQQSPGRPIQMDRIPESRVPATGESYLQPPSRNAQITRNREQQSYTTPITPSDIEMQSPSVSTPWETSSAASVSSHNTKASKRTSNSTFSKTDLQQRSVLSLSSESEGEDSDVEPMLTPATSSIDKASRILNGQSPSYSTNARLSNVQIGARSDSRGHSKRSPLPSNFKPIPEASIPDHRLSGPWTAPPMEPLPQLPDQKRSSKRVSVRPKGSEQQNHSNQLLVVPRDGRPSVPQPRDVQKAGPSKSSVSRNPSISSQQSHRSSSQPTPPLSPSSVVFRVDPEHSNRFMAVTKQEEALLEALRQKRAKMREQIIEEHEVGHRSPPRPVEKSRATRYSETSSISTYRGLVGPSKQTVLMVMETPVSDANRGYTAEPSPDLSDFLGFGSDEDSTPRTSYVAPRKTGEARPDSLIATNPRIPTAVAMSSSSSVRLSAVGSGYRFEEGRTQSVKKKNSIVRFAEDTRHEFFDEEDEDDGLIWGM